MVTERENTTQYVGRLDPCNYRRLLNLWIAFDKWSLITYKLFPLLWPLLATLLPADEDVKELLELQ